MEKKEFKKDKLKEARVQRGLTQRDLASKAEVAFATVQRAEYTGRITIESLEKLANALSMTPAYFFD